MITFQQKKEYIAEICSNMHFITVDGSSYIYKEPDHRVCLIAENLYKQYYLESVESGLYSEEEYKSMLEEQGIWNSGYEQELEQTQQKTKELKKELPKYTFRSNHKKQIKENIDALNKKIEKLLEKKGAYFNITASYSAQFKKLKWVLTKTIYDENENLIWDDLNELNQNTDMQHIKKLIHATQTLNIYDETNIRAIARSEPWRTKWKVSSKTGEQLFGVPSANYTDSQYLLSYWSIMYDIIFESMDAPAYADIEDDDLVDAWFEEQQRKMDDRSKESSSKLRISNSKIANSQEIFIPVDTPDDAKNVYNNLNDDSAKRVVEERMKTITTQGSVKEANLPDVQRNIRMQSNRAHRDSVKRKTQG